MPCCLHGYPHPKHGCVSASLSSEYHECSFNSQNTPYNNCWADAFCLFTELEEVTLQRDLFTWACRRQGKTPVRSSKQPPQIFTGRLRPRFWTCRKTTLGCYLGEELCVVGLVGNGLPIPKVTVAGSCVSCWNSIAEMGGKGQCTCGNSLTLESAHIKSPKASTLISVEVGPARFWSSGEIGMWGDIYTPYPEGSNGRPWDTM